MFLTGSLLHHQSVEWFDLGPKMIPYSSRVTGECEKVIRSYKWSRQSNQYILPIIIFKQIYWCQLSTWFFKFALWVVLYSHWLQGYHNFSWVVSMSFFKFALCVVLYSHWLQGYRVSSYLIFIDLQQPIKTFKAKITLSISKISYYILQFMQFLPWPSQF